MFLFMFYLNCFTNVWNVCHLHTSLSGRFYSAIEGKILTALYWDSHGKTTKQIKSFFFGKKCFAGLSQIWEDSHIWLFEQFSQKRINQKLKIENQSPTFAENCCHKIPNKFQENWWWFFSDFVGLSLSLSLIANIAKPFL